jgi:hypothetical protein
MKGWKLAVLVFVALIASGVQAHTPLFPNDPAIFSRDITWYYDGSCRVSPLPELHRATRILDRLLTRVTITLSPERVGHNRADDKSTWSCHDKAWMEARGAWPSGAFVDHDGTPGNRVFDAVFCEDPVFCAEHDANGNIIPWGYGSALHEWLHALLLNHSFIDHWSAVYISPWWAAPPLYMPVNPHHTGWTEYPSNDDIVGLSTIYPQAADCTPYMSLSGKLYLPYIPVTTDGKPNPNAYTGGYWAVLQHVGNGQFKLLELGDARTFRYNCAMQVGPGVITAVGYNETAGAMMSFRLTNNDPTGKSKTYWTATGI